MSRARFLYAALACALACEPVLADRSLGDDEVDEAGDCEVELAVGRLVSRDAPRERGASLELLCGVGLRTELAASFERRRLGPARERSIGLEAKTQLVGRTPARTGWSLVYGAVAERTMSSSWRRTEHYALVQASAQPAPNWVVEGRLGTLRDRVERNDRTLWALSIEHAWSERVEAVAEVEGDDRGRPLAGVALRYILWPDRALITVSLGSRAGPQRERRLGLATTIEF